MCSKSLCQVYPVEEGTAAHSSSPAWEIPWNMDGGSWRATVHEVAGSNTAIIWLHWLHFMHVFFSLNKTFMLKTSCALFPNMYTTDKFALNNNIKKDQHRHFFTWAKWFYHH